MNASSFFALLVHAARDTIRAPLLYLPLALLFLIMTAFNALVPFLPSQLIASPLYPLLSPLLLLFIAAFPLAALLAAADDKVSKRKATLRHMAATAYCRGVPNFIIMCIIALAYALLTQLALLMGKSLIPLNASLATLAVLLILFAGLTGVLIFLTFANIFCVICSFSVIRSVRQSILFVHKNYLLVLSLSIVFFVVNALLDFLPPLLAELFRSFLLTPYLALVLLRIFVSVHVGEPRETAPFRARRAHRV